LGVSVPEGLDPGVSFVVFWVSGGAAGAQISSRGSCLLGDSVTCERSGFCMLSVPGSCCYLVCMLPGQGIVWCRDLVCWVLGAVRELRGVGCQVQVCLLPGQGIAWCRDLVCWVLGAVRELRGAGSCLLIGVARSGNCVVPVSCLWVLGALRELRGAWILFVHRCAARSGNWGVGILFGGSHTCTHTYTHTHTQTHPHLPGEI